MVARTSEKTQDQNESHPPGGGLGAGWMVSDHRRLLVKVSFVVIVSVSGRLISFRER